jgi:hypothetical protein
MPSNTVGLLLEEKEKQAHRIDGKSYSLIDSAIDSAHVEYRPLSGNVFKTCYR